MAVLMVTHDYAVVKKYRARTVRMVNGKTQNLVWKGEKLVPEKS
jgi:cell division transport system ATP-binding protein